MRIALAVVVLTSLTACTITDRLSPYRIDVQQGNFVTQEMVAVLKPGMTKDQVRFALGTPLVVDVFHADRWDYIYRRDPGRGERQQRKLTVFFDQDRLLRVDGDVVAKGTEGEAASGVVPGRVIEIEGPKKQVAPATPAGADAPAPQAN